MVENTILPLSETILFPLQRLILIDINPVHEIITAFFFVKYSKSRIDALDTKCKLYHCVLKHSKISTAALFYILSNSSFRYPCLETL